jgi:hypothetical protein
MLCWEARRPTLNAGRDRWGQVRAAVCPWEGERGSWTRKPARSLFVHHSRRHENSTPVR